MQTPGKRLREARKHLGLTLRRFAEPLGVSHSAVNEWENGTVSNLSVIHTTAIEQIHKISGDWLLTGTGDMMIDDSKTTFLFPTSTTPDEVRLPLLPFSKLFRSKEALRDTHVYVPFNKGLLLDSVDSADQLFLTQVENDLMAPTVNKGDLVMVDRSASDCAFQEGLWIYSMRTAVYLKRLQWTGNTYLASTDNSAYPAVMLELNNDTQFNLIGRVVWSDKRW